MWRLLASSEPVPDDLAANLTQLLQSTMRKIVVSSALVYLLAQLALSATWPTFFTWRILPVAAIVIATAALTYALITRHFLLSQIVWGVGISAAVVLGAMTYQSPQILLLLALPPLTVIVTLGWQAGTAAWAAAVLTTLFLGQQGYVVGVTWPLVIGLALTGALIAILGWATTSSLVTVLIWFLHAEEESRKNLENARTHRAKLVATVKQLDQLNYRLARTNTALAAAWRTADEALSFKAEFVTNVSHELRTPLNLIIGFSEVMTLSPESYGGQKLPGPYRADVNAIYNSAKHLMALVDDVLDLGRIDANQLVFARDQVEIDTLLQEVQAIIRDQIEGKGLEYRQYVEPDLTMLQMDRLRIRQVLLNLLVNALRFTSQGAIIVEVTRRQHHVLFSVTDSGQGISTADIDQIFEPFHSVDHQLDDVWPEGKGLGLPISKKYVEMHGGAMGAESEFGKGATVWFTLPCASHPRRRHGGTARSPSHFHSQRETADQLLILAFDDPATQALLARRLDGFKLLAADKVDEAATMAAELHPVAVVVDRGNEEKPRQIPTLGNTPIMPLPWLTSSQIAEQLGVEALLVKPIGGEQLLATFDRLPGDIHRILLADEDPGLVRLYRRMLRPRLPAGSFLDAYNGDEALQRALDEQPGLIIIAVEMTDSHGEPAFQRLIAGAAQTGGARIILTSAQHWAESGLDHPDSLQVRWQNGFTLSRLIGLMRAVLSEMASN